MARWLAIIAGNTVCCRKFIIIHESYHCHVLINFSHIFDYLIIIYNYDSWRSGIAHQLQLLIVYQSAENYQFISYLKSEYHSRCMH